MTWRRPRWNAPSQPTPSTPFAKRATRERFGSGKIAKTGLNTGQRFRGAEQSMIEEKLKETIQLTVDFLQRTLPDRLLWMVAPARRTLEYVFGPVLDHPGRFPWWGFVAALTIAAAAY